MRKKSYYGACMGWTQLMLLIIPLWAKEYSFNFSAIFGSTRGDVQPLLIIATQLVERGHHVNIFTDRPNQSMIVDYVEEYFHIPAENEYTSVTSSSVEVRCRRNLVSPEEDLLIQVPFDSITYHHRTINDIQKAEKDSSSSATFQVEITMATDSEEMNDSVEIEANVFGTLRIFSSHHDCHCKPLMTYYLDFDKIARTGDNINAQEERGEERLEAALLFDEWTRQINNQKQSILINFCANSNSKFILANSYSLQDPTVFFDTLLMRAKEHNQVYFAVSEFATFAHEKYKNWRKGSIFPTHQKSHRLPKDLEAWLYDQRKIIVVAMGSMNLACFSSTNQTDDTNPVCVAPVLDSIKALLNQDDQQEYSILFIVNNPKDQTQLQEQFQLNDRVYSSLPISFQSLFVRAHNLIAVFCSHGGAGSVVESLSFGIPNMVFAFMHDQPMNGQFVADNKLGSYVHIKDIINGIQSPLAVANDIKTTILEQDCCRENAEKIGHKINQEQGAQRLLTWLENAEPTQPENKSEVLRTEENAEPTQPLGTENTSEVLRTEESNLEKKNNE